tara:strand:- start:1344 stop:1586 length:243 start_codon:yes stop_codon:yes gene_type:complete
MSVHDINEELRAVIRDSADNATEVLAYVTSRTDNPLLAMTSLMLSSAVFAKSIGMTREAFLEGTAAAFDSLVEDTPHATH